MKLMVIDSQGAGNLATLQKLLPDVRVRGIDHPDHRGYTYHPHGHWCGWLAGVPLQAHALKIGQPGAHELVFLQIFDKDSKALSDSFMFEQIAAEQPDYLSRSWGAWDQDDPFIRTGIDGFYREHWVPSFAKLQDGLGFVDFGAAGNNDANDSDSDVAYPQAAMPERCNIIGARARNGRPAKWSGDGRGVLHTMWAAGVASPNPDGSWTRWSGTSAATPKAAGVCAALEMDADTYRGLVADTASRPEGYKLPHPKWGWGDMEYLWQSFAADLPRNLLPPAKTGTLRITHHDFNRIRRK